jgi:hypothetical protein
MGPYGSVLPPPAANAVAPAGPSAPGAPALPATGAAAPGSPGVVPVVTRERGRIEHDPTERDIELARKALIELANAGRQTDAGGTEWAVAYAHSRRRSGWTLWVATNQGVCWLPPRVYLRQNIHEIASVDEHFDRRYFHWFVPAEKAVLAATAWGDRVTAVATTQSRQSDRHSDALDHPDLTVEYCVNVTGRHTEASELTSKRQHRLQTISADTWRLYEDLADADESRARRLCRDVIAAVAVELGDRKNMPPVAGEVARAVIDRRPPTEQQWSELVREYERHAAAVMPRGIDGDSSERVDEELMKWCSDGFATARLLEALVCWHAEPFDPADLVYAAWTAGVRAPLGDFVGG